MDSKQLTNVVYGGYWKYIISNVGLDKFDEGLTTTVNLFVKSGKKVTLLLDTPNFSFLPEFCVYENLVSFSICDLSYQEHVSERGQYLHVFEKFAKHEMVEIVDVSDQLCDEAKCSMVRGATVLYRDKNHLNIPASKMLGEQVFLRSAFLDF